MDDILFEKKFSHPMDYCDEIINHVSRSFALGINTLKGALRKDVLIGYLLCRIADTIEDDLKLPSEKKCEYLTQFIHCFENRRHHSLFSKVFSQLTGDPYHINLVKNTSWVFEVYHSLFTKSQDILKKWVLEMTNGMIQFIQKYPNGIRVSSLQEYKEYCYFVAGTVGYMLTDLWKSYSAFIDENRYQELQKSAGIFGEALQTINILKDIAWDLKNENAVFVPAHTLNENSIHEIVDLAQEDLKIALKYVEQIPKANFSIRFFCIFPLLLAFATLREIKKSPSILNPDNKIKVKRAETIKIYKHAYLSAASNTWLNIYAEKCMTEGET